MTHSSIVEKYNSMTPSMKALVVANAIPLLGLLLFNWSLFSVMFAYWLENVIIGFFTILKIIKAQAPNSSSMRINGKPVTGTAKAFIIPFFMMHFGIFTAVHGVFVFGIFGFMSIDPAIETGGIAMPNLIQFMDFSFVGFAIIAVALMVSHGISYQTNFIGKGEYKKISPGAAMMAPYSRVIVLHLILLGSGFLGIFGFNKVTASIIVIAKILLDYWLHKKEHKKFFSVDKMSAEKSVVQ